MRLFSRGGADRRAGGKNLFPVGKRAEPSGEVIGPSSDGILATTDLRDGRKTMICVAVTYVVKPGHEEEGAELFRKLTGHTRAEPGCRMYLAHRSPIDPRRFFLYEQYVDQASLDAHRAAPYFEKYVKEGLFPIIESRTPELFEPLTD
jgi:quinol monooxygenase YgiN